MCSAEVGEGPSEPFKGFQKSPVSFPATSLIILHISVLMLWPWGQQTWERPVCLFQHVSISVWKLWSQLRTLLHVFVSEGSAGFTWTNTLAGNGSKDMLWSVRSMCKWNQIYSVHGASLGALSVRIVNWEALHGFHAEVCTENTRKKTWSWFLSCPLYWAKNKSTSANAQEICIV